MSGICDRNMSLGSGIMSKMVGPARTLALTAFGFVTAGSGSAGFGNSVFGSAGSCFATAGSGSSFATASSMGDPTVSKKNSGGSSSSTGNASATP